MQTLPFGFATGNERKRVARSWFLLLTSATICVPAIAICKIGSSQSEITGPISQTELDLKQDGSAAHPYSDANQCPTRTDVVFWPNASSVPRMPPGISVCFVGNQPFETSGPERVELRNSHHQSSSASRFTAGAFGFLTLIQYLEQPKL
jgi:hypothetical protein